MGERDALSRRIAIALAVVVVLGGALAILQKGASVHESNYARETTRVAVHALRAHVVVDVFRGTAAPGALRRLSYDAERASLRQHALAETRIAWNDRSTRYTTVIAILAAALFLVGFGLVVEGGLRRVTALAGLAVAGFAVGWAAWLHAQPIPGTPARAVDAAARGAVSTAAGDFDAAVTAYGDAIGADADYAAAHTGRARARLLAANPDFEITGAYTDTAGRASAAGVRDAAVAVALDERDALALALLALGVFYRGEHRRALRAADMALAANPNVPDMWLLRSAILAALGDALAAERSRARGERLAGEAGVSQRLRLLTSRYLGQLEWVARTEPARAATARRLSDRAVAAETATTLGRRPAAGAPEPGGVGVEGLRVAGGRLTMVLRWRGLARNTALSALAYERPERGGAWAQATDLAVFATVSGDGERRISVPLRRACPPTAVRADVFLDGAPALSRTGPGAPPTC